MRKRKALGGVVTLNVSEGPDVDERGRVVNKDIPEDERKHGSKKSRARSQMKKQKETARRRIEQEHEEQEGKRRRRSKKDKPTEPVKGVKGKRRRRTVGELLEIDKKRGTSKAQKRLAKLGGKVSNTVAEIDSETDVAELLLGELVPEQTTERDFQEEYNRIFTTLGNLCRKLEKDMNKPDSKISSRDVYALMTMYSQMRETIADLRSISDINAQADFLISELFDPYHKTVGETMVSLLYKIMTHLRQSLSEDMAHHVGERLKEIISEEALSLQRQFESTKEKVSTVLNASK